MALGNLGAVAYDIVANDKTATGTKSSSDRFKSVSLVAGAAMTTAGVAIVGFTDQSKKFNASLGVTGLQIGATKEEMRDLALSTTNVTFPLVEVQKSFDLLARAGMTNKEQMASTATAFDTLGDAIGLPASAVTSTLIPAFNAFDIPLQDAADHTDAFTHLVRNTTVDLNDFSTTMNYLAPDIDTLGLGLSKTVGIMEALAARGIQGSAATKEFRKAVSAADGDITLLYEALGLTADEVAGYATEIESADGMTKQFADAANEQYGMVDNLKQKWSEWSLSIGSALEPLDFVGGALATGGPMMMGMSGLVNILPVLSGLQVSTFVPALYATATAGWAAVAPWLPIILGVGAVIAVGWLLYSNWDAVTALLGGIWTGLSDTAGAAWGGLVDLIKGYLNFLIGLLNGFIGIWNMVKFEVPSVDLPMVGRVGGFSVKVPQIPTIPNLAKGGIIDQPTLALIGEAGPEAVVPLGGGSNSTASIGGDTLHIGQIVVRNDQDLDEIFRRWEEMQRSKRVQRGVRA